MTATSRRTRKPKKQIDPDTIEADNFTDAALAEIVARDAFANRFCFTSGMGWLQWSGQRWARVEEKVVTEAIRQHVRHQYIAALKRKHDAVVDRLGSKVLNEAEADEQGWHKYQAATRIDAVRKLAAGIEGIFRDAADFDADPDVLNTPAGLLHLDTLTVEPHDPSHLVTLITAVDWKPDAESPEWKTILEALPDGTESYMQARCGQGVTGHAPDDDAMLMLAGGGSNGKTLFMLALTKSLGDCIAGTGYAQHIASEMLLSGGTKGAATPEKMDLRGARLAYVEETPEDRYLSVNTLKQIVGTPTIKGRLLYKDLVTFKATHSLFLNTNFPPKVVETDDGSWRRLLKIEFPYRFRPVDASGKPLDNRGNWLANDRPAHPHVKGMLEQEIDHLPILEAALAWLVAGAHAWYTHGRALKTKPIPRAIREATAEWRAESDYIYGFIQERMAECRDSWVTSQDFYDELCEFMETQTRKAREVTPAQSTVISRLKGHTGLGFPLAFKKQRGEQLGRSFRRPDDMGRSTSTALGEKQQAAAIIGLRFKQAGE